MAEGSAAHNKESRGVSRRAVLVGLALIPLNALWVLTMEQVWESGTPTQLSLFFNAVFLLLALAMGNLALRRWARRWALKPEELVVIYVMLCLGTAMASHDFFQPLAYVLTSASYFATPENRWDELFVPHLPRSLIVTDPTAVRHFWEGGGNLYCWEGLRPWLGPVSAWIGFMVLLMAAMMCINAVVRRRWSEHEKLGYPLTELPFQLTRPGFQLLARDLLGSRLLWLGFALTAGLDLLNGFAHLHPALPSLHVRYTDLTALLKAYPWRAMGWTVVGIYPFAIGLGCLMPQDLSFSCWFFYWFWKAELVASYLVGQYQEGRLSLSS